MNKTERDEKITVLLIIGVIGSIFLAIFYYTEENSIWHDYSLTMITILRIAIIVSIGFTILDKIENYFKNIERLEKKEKHSLLFTESHA